MNRVIASLLLLWPECKVGFFYDLIDSDCEVETIITTFGKTNHFHSKLFFLFNEKTRGKNHRFVKVAKVTTVLIIVSGLSTHNMSQVSQSNS